MCFSWTMKSYSVELYMIAQRFEEHVLNRVSCRRIWREAEVGERADEALADGKSQMGSRTWG